MTDQTPEELAAAQATLAEARRLKGAQQPRRELDLDDYTPPTREQLAAASAIVRADRIAKQAAREQRDKQIAAERETQAEAVRRARLRLVADRAEARSRGEPIPDDSDPGEPSLSLVSDLEWKETTANGIPLKGFANAVVCVKLLGLKCSRDIFLDKYTVEGDAIGTLGGELSDPLVRQFRKVCADRFGFEPGKDASYDALQHVCEENTFDSLRVLLDPLVWDGVPRLDKWLTTYAGAEDTELHTAWGALVLMAAVRRAYDPGCVFQHVLVLEGLEGKDKSALVKVLACGQADEKPLYFSDSPILHLKEREQQELTKGVWFYEIAEMAHMQSGDEHAIKRFITAEEERARAAYAHFKTNQPRVSIFIGTFNTDANTGGVVSYLNLGDRRRWFPLPVGVVHPIDIPALKRDRLQLFAEAKVRVSRQPFDELGMERSPWRPLRLPRKFWEAAGVIQKEREHISPISDHLSTLYSEIMVRPTRGSLQGFSVAPGRDYIVSKDDVWISANLVVKLVGNMDRSGRKIPGALSAIGWSRVKDKRGGLFPDPVRGYSHAMTAALPADPEEPLNPDGTDDLMDDEE